MSHRALVPLLAVVAGASCARSMSWSGADARGGAGRGLEASSPERGSAGERPASAEAMVAQFGAPRLVAEISNPSDDVDDSDPSLSANRLELYFSSTGRPGGVQYEDLWRTERGAVNMPWKKPVLVPLSTGSRDSAPALSPDGLTLAFASNRPGGSGGWDVWISTRSSLSDTWPQPAPAVGINTASSDELPASISDDRLVLLFNGGGGLQTDLYVASRKTTAEAWAIAKLANVNSAGFDSHPAMTANQLALAFDSERPGGKGLRDLYLAVRSSKGTEFPAPTALVELNTAANDADPWISDDLRTIFFARSPVGSTGIFSGPSKIYQATR